MRLVADEQRAARDGAGVLAHAIAAPAIAAQPAADPSRADGGSAVIKANADLWITLAPGIEVKPLRVAAEKRSQTSLWRLAAGAVLPEHDHAAEEECLIVSGDMEWNGVRYGEGDFIVVRSGFHHTEMHSPNGAMLLIRGELQACLAQAFG